MTAEDLEALRRAAWLLEHPGLAARLTNMVGKPIELVANALPAPAKQAITTATSKALGASLRMALQTMQNDRQPGSPLLHKVLASASGAAGGAFGLASLPIELPVSTIIMLRSIADIARSEGENLALPESAIACVEVFALGGRAGSTDASESSYFAVRAMLAKSVSEAARFVAERGVVEEGAPVLIRLVALLASRFGVIVSQKIAAQAVPVIGAFCGAAVNYSFVEHFSGCGTRAFHGCDASSEFTAKSEFALNTNGLRGTYEIRGGASNTGFHAFLSQHRGDYWLSVRTSDPRGSC